MTGNLHTRCEAFSPAAQRRVRAALARVRSGKEKTIPQGVVWRIIDGVHPVKAWRLDRGMTTVQLAKKANLTDAMISMIENRKREASGAALRRLAKALDAPVSTLIAEK